MKGSRGFAVRVHVGERGRDRGRRSGVRDHLIGRRLRPGTGRGGCDQKKGARHEDNGGHERSPNSPW